MIKNEYIFLGKNIETISIYYGFFLIVWGIVITILSKSLSITSLIPSFLGLPILILSYLSTIHIKRKKLLMHLVATFALITFFGGLDFIRVAFSYSMFLNFWADISKLMMSITGSIFMFLCIQSFVFARKNR